MVTSQAAVEQYRTSANLEVRIDIHERFSTNPYPWMWWVFDHFEFSPTCKILEVGCGAGKLWLENAHRISATWNVILSDVSTGMLQKTKANLQEVQRKFDLTVFGVECIPFGPYTFDAVIANHMLYYAVDPAWALAEIHRVLKQGGKLYASTNGMNHLKEMDDLMVGYRGGARPIASVIQRFSLDNGQDLLERYFGTVRLYGQDNALLINDCAALTAFCLSLTRAEIADDKHTDFAEYVEGHLRERGGEMRIAKDSGVFIAAKA